MSTGTLPEYIKQKDYYVLFENLTTINFKYNS